ncbi:hypothetical protein E4T80_11825 [Muribacter muris]|uniref:Uncharacterized protein n=2 Tax=Muribacter muris TaxID=67855 RepID=A0A4Y9JSX5_9PAST|nr:hypothetical protein [Muribacter muris]MBF0786148.1 hypothetical protein [Muribacter muris]TFV07820.1 hypothetical protein E4T80_11825 [Muribacter muris]
MSLKSKLSALAAAYKSACANSETAWQNTDCSISESVKESTKIQFALFWGSVEAYETRKLREEVSALRKELRERNH